jgi:hypothetical protein
MAIAIASWGILGVALFLVRALAQGLVSLLAQFLLAVARPDRVSRRS